MSCVCADMCVVCVMVMKRGNVIYKFKGKLMYISPDTVFAERPVGYSHDYVMKLRETSKLPVGWPGSSSSATRTPVAARM